LRTRRKSFHANMHSSNYHQRHAKRCCCSWQLAWSSNLWWNRCLSLQSRSRAH
jgi:hypothetical protein